MAKLGPFWRSDNCSVVRGAFDKLITHLLVWSWFIHVSLELEGWSLGAESVLVEGVGAMDVAGTTGFLEVWVELLEKLDGTFWCPLIVLCASMFSRFGFAWRDYDGIHRVNLLTCLPFVLSCLCSFILFINNLHLSRSKSGPGSVSWTCWFGLFSMFSKSLNFLYWFSLFFEGFQSIVYFF